MEIDLLEKKKKAFDSDLRYKGRQYNDCMPFEPEMRDNGVAFLTLMSIERDRDRLDVEIAQKRLELYSLQAGEVPEVATIQEAAKNESDAEAFLPIDLHDEPHEESQRMDARTLEPEAEQVTMVGFDARPRLRSIQSVSIADSYTYPSEPHILRLLNEAGANSRAAAIDRNWLDSQLINRIERVKTRQAVDFGLIELRRKGLIDYEGKPKRVWIVKDGI